MSNMEDWRIPNEEEKKHIASWINKHMISGFYVAIVIIGIIFTAYISIEVIRFFRFEKIIWGELFFLPYLIIPFTGCMINFLAWKKKLRLIMDGTAWINDAKVTDYDYVTHLLEVNYFEKDELKIVKAIRYSGIGSFDNGGENGYIIYFFTKKKVPMWLYRDYLFVPGRV